MIKRSNVPTGGPMFFFLSFYQPNYDYQSYARLMTADLFLKSRLEQQLLNLKTLNKMETLFLSGGS
jgi:hypothetical protein